MSTFNLRNFLTENKLTKTSRLINEQTEMNAVIAIQVPSDTRRPQVLDSVGGNIVDGARELARTLDLEDDALIEFSPSDDVALLYEPYGKRGYFVVGPKNEHYEFLSNYRENLTGDDDIDIFDADKLEDIVGDFRSLSYSGKVPAQAS